MQSDEHFRDQARMRREVLDSIFDEQLAEDPESRRLTRKHAALSMELEGIVQDPINPLNRPRELVVSELSEVVEDIKRLYG